MSSIPQRWPAYRPVALGLVTLMLLVGVLGVWSVSTRIAGAVIAQGMVQLESNRQVIQHPQGGVVGEIFVRDGDSVDAGDVLLRLDETFTRSELVILDGQLDELRSRQARFRAERDGSEGIIFPSDLEDRALHDPSIAQILEGQRTLFETRATALVQERAQINEQIAQTRNQIIGIRAQLSALREQDVFVSRDLRAQRELLTQGYTVTERVNVLEREHARLLGETGQLDATVSQLRGQIAGLEIQNLRLLSARQEEAEATLRDLELREIELSERQITARETLARMVIRAPVSGIIYGSQIFAQQSVISPAQPLMYVIPQDRPLIIVARVESIHIDQVHVGQDVALRFSAFDQRQTPELFGTVVRVSADIFTNEATGLSFYQAELLPNEGELSKLGQQQLLPGMPVEAYIRTGERTPLSYLTKPLLDYFNNAFRET